jgi:protein SCO1/2
MSTPSGAPIHPAFDLVDHDGRSVTPAAFAGRFVLVFFGFTHCRVVCPRELGKLSRALERLGPAVDRIQALYISVDPERDTPAVMKTFLEARFPRFLGLTGAREQVEAAKRSFRVFTQRRDDPAAPGGYDVPHTAIAYVLDRQGRYLAHFLDVATEDQLVQRLGGLVA